MIDIPDYKQNELPEALAKTAMGVATLQRWKFNDGDEAKECFRILSEILDFDPGVGPITCSQGNDRRWMVQILWRSEAETLLREVHLAHNPDFDKSFIKMFRECADLRRQGFCVSIEKSFSEDGRRENWKSYYYDRPGGGRRDGPSAAEHHLTRRLEQDAATLAELRSERAAKD
jgi:hypothetical protein